MDGGLSEIKFLYDVLKDRPELFITVVLLIMWYLERGERKIQQKENAKLINTMVEKDKDTNETLGQIKFLLEVLTKGRI